ncbi:MAG TPA: CoA transferase [Methylomirabilota bacterium]|jgi:crotonobetainyl-CoA:carnitine CoA-transferase CaiB-like acyl-CoA transferase|nr:CoA transferase [Methylomirabilota bacterium]
MTHPFAGVTVLEFGHFIAVPWAGQVLADGGAHVIKIEPLEGEPSRHIAPLGGGESRHFLIRNRGKHALPLDLRHPDARPILDALVARADVVLSNMRPGLAAELGLEYEQLAARHPRIIVGSVTAFGARGPDAALAGMDLVVQGRSGLMVTGGRVRDGLVTTGESPIADYMAAALLAFGVASALYRRERTGRGGRVDTSLLLAALALQNNLMVRVEGIDGPRHAAFADWLKQARAGGVPFAEQVERMPRNRVVASQAIYIRTYATKDAALAVACGSPSLRRKFIAAVGHTDPGLTAPVADPEAHYAVLKAAVEATIASRTTEEWKAVLDAAGVPVSGIALPVEILDDPQPAANDMFHRFAHQTLGPVTVLGPPVRVDEGGFAPGPVTPPFGSETRAILEWAGFAAADLERLLAGGAVTPKDG